MTKVPFGFRQVKSQDKPGMVQDVFEGVATRYDLMNDLMSFGLHRFWKRYFVTRLHPRPEERLLDLAGGTGDIARSYLSRGGGSAIVCDLTLGMLQQGQNLDRSQRYLDRLTWLQGDGEKIPLADESVSTVSISFGLRNTTDPEQVIKEGWRVLRAGGGFYCMEFSQPRHPWVRRAYDAYSSRALPGLGRLIAKDESAYRYLHESVRSFASLTRIEEWYKDAGFVGTRSVSLSGGIVTITSGLKP